VCEAAAAAPIAELPTLIAMTGLPLSRASATAAAKRGPSLIASI
jgi:hypothetical protein